MSKIQAHLSPALPEREAAADAVYRAVLSFDTADSDLLRSAVFPNASFTIGDVKINGLEDIFNKSFNFVSKLDTTHFLSNMRVSLTSDTTAKITCSAQAFHYRTGEGIKPGSARLVSGGLYFVDAEKDSEDGLWKIRDWKLQLIWTEGDRAVMKQD